MEAILKGTNNRDGTVEGVVHAFDRADDRGVTYCGQRIGSECEGWALAPQMSVDCGNCIRSIRRREREGEEVTVAIAPDAERQLVQGVVPKGTPSMTVTEVTHRAKERRRGRIYCFMDGDNVLEDFWRRVTGVKYIPDHYRTALPELWHKLGVDNPPPVRWSNTAGCECGCSPGFIIQDDSYPDDIWMTVTWTQEETPVWGGREDRGGTAPGDV